MNIVTQFPVNLNLNFTNPSTEQARKESQLRELISQASDAEQSATEKGLNSDTEKSAGRPQPLTYDYVKSQQNSAQTKEQALDNSTSDQNATDEQENRGKDRQQAEIEAREQEKVDELKARDQEVRIHEQAHASVGGQYAGSPTYEYERGPDGNNYAVAGEVQIDVSKVPNDPNATINKMQHVKRAALAPNEPSSADRKVAAEADQKIQEARTEELQQRAEVITENGKIERKEQPSVIKASDIAEQNIQVQSVPYFEAKQALKAEPELNDIYNNQLNITDTQATERALRIQKHYNVSSQPSTTNLSTFA